MGVQHRGLERHIKSWTPINVDYIVRHEAVYKIMVGTRLRMELANRQVFKVGRGAHDKPFQYREALRIIERIARVGP